MTGWYSLLSGIALKSILLLGAAGLVAILMGRRSAATRHIIWMAVFASLLALPLLTASLPELPALKWMAPEVRTREHYRARRLKAGGSPEGPPHLWSGSGSREAPSVSRKWRWHGWRPRASAAKLVLSPASRSTE